jgi:hypothetical protein
MEWGFDISPSPNRDVSFYFSMNSSDNRLLMATASPGGEVECLSILNSLHQSDTSCPCPPNIRLVLTLSGCIFQANAVQSFLEIRNPRDRRICELRFWHSAAQQNKAKD